MILNNARNNVRFKHKTAHSQYLLSGRPLGNLGYKRLTKIQKVSPESAFFICTFTFVGVI